MKSRADFLLGVSLVDPSADPIVMEFQQELLSEARINIQAPCGLFRELGPDQFAEHVADYYLKQHPKEVERVGREAVMSAVRDAIEWGKEDAVNLSGEL